MNDSSSPSLIGAWGKQIGLVLLLATIVCGWRIPVMFRSPPGQDEDLYAVPSSTILESGIPRIPYMPSRDRASIYYYADTILYALPPLSFYCQALVESVLGQGLGQARMNSLLMGIVAACCVYRLAILWSSSQTIAFISASFFMLSRGFYFPATTARPDMTAVAFGLLAVTFLCTATNLSVARVSLCGWLCGLSMLAHPVGIVPLTHCWLSLIVRRNKVIRNTLLLGTLAACGLGLWLPLIAIDFDVFSIQFGGNVLSRSGEGLVNSFMRPWIPLRAQLLSLYEHLGPIQIALFAIGLITVVVTGPRGLRFHAIVSLGTLCFFMGQHPTKGYWAYPLAFAAITLAVSMGKVLGQLSIPRLSPQQRPVLAVLLLGLFLPGSGIRPAISAIRNWNDPAFNAKLVADEVIRSIPAHSLIAADASHSLFFYLARRPVVNAIVYPFYFDVRTTSFDYVVFGRDSSHPKQFLTDLKLVNTYGSVDNIFAPYGELYEVARGSPGSPPGRESSESSN